MERKTNIIKLRVTPAFYGEIKRRSIPFHSMSAYVQQALSEFSDATSRDKLSLAKCLAESYSSIDVKLAHVGGNLNQAMRRINERAVAGLPYDSLLLTSALPEITECMNLCKEIRGVLKDITMKLAK